MPEGDLAGLIDPLSPCRANIKVGSGPGQLTRGWQKLDPYANR
jgi:hypothetical protein